MNEIVFHDAYNPAQTYSGNFSKLIEYEINSDGNRTPRSFNNNWPNSPTAYLVNSDQGMPGKYLGNYLNWVYFHATAAQRSAIPNYTKIQAAKSTINAVLGSITNVRFAIERFNDDNGGTIIAPFGTSVAAMQTTVNNIQADAWTPLAESMVTALNYFSTTGASAPIQASCQKSFAVLITDGLPTKDANVPGYLKANDCGHNDPGSCSSLSPAQGYPNSYDCTAYIDNVTCYMYRNDLRSDLPDIQNVAVSVIGFDVNHSLLQVAANEGGGDYYTTRNLAGLQSALAQVFSTIEKRVAAGSSVSVVAAEDRANNRLFRARYESGSWRGFVEAFNLPFQAGSPPIWEAGSLLAARDPNTRTIYTTTNGTSLTGFTTGNSSALRTLLGAATVAEATNIITYIRGGAIAGTRDREGWILGDIVDASPVAIGKPTGYSSLPGYAAFRAAHSGRSEVLYVSGNDGMLHCFDTADGQERWAYVPKTQLPRVKELMNLGYCHQYFVNTTPAVYDIRVSGQWKTVLFGGEDPGRNGMFALDVTNPTAGNVSLLWDLDISGLKGSSNPPTLVYDRFQNAHVLCVGTGYSTSSSADSMIVLNPATGQVINRMLLGSAVAGNKTTRAVVMDKDYDGNDDLLYIGDLAGRLWRIDLRTNPWTKTLIFSCNQPISATPVVTIDATGRPLIFFGTGRFLTTADPTTTTTQSIYGLIDDGTSTTYTPSDLVNQSTSISAIPSNKRGWYINLTQGSGERTTRSAALINGTLYVTSFKPGESCGGGGQSWFYTLDYKDGSAPDHANGNANNTTSGRAQSMGDGLIADPTVDLANNAILLQSSNAVVMSQSISGNLKKLLVRGWHQKWQ
jgi:type IV pilus assembly protein PilY1